MSQHRESSLTIGIIGLGYVGLPLAHALHRAGAGAGAREGAGEGAGSIRVLGVDTDPAKPAALKPPAGERARAYLKHLGQALYDDLPDSAQVAVRVAWDERIAAILDDLDFTDRLRAAGKPWAEADDDGNLVMRARGT